MTETVGERLRRLRVEQGLSQRDVEVPGVSYAYVGMIEVGKRTPSVKAIRRLASRLGVSASYLEHGVDLLAIAEQALDEGLLDVARRAIRAARGLETPDAERTLRP